MAQITKAQMGISNDRQALSRLVEVGIALSSTTDLKHLLKMITTEARGFARCDAGSIYIKENDKLKFVINQCDSYEPDLKTTISRSIFLARYLDISRDSIAGYVALSKETELIDDAYDLPPGKPYVHSKVFDELGNYKTRSILTVPMIDTEDSLVGVLQLINHLDESGTPAPFPQEVLPIVQALASQAAVAIRNTQLQEELKSIHSDTIIRLLTAVEFRDDQTGNHVQRVASYSGLIADHMGLPAREREKIVSASLLHDVGKVAMPDSILMKPGPLTRDEWKVMKSHTEIGARILQNSRSQLLELCEEIALSHHEKWDGTGYPHGLRGQAIPVSARIVALADVFDAITSTRCYKHAVPFEEVLPTIQHSSGLHFDPNCVEGFFKGLEGIRKVYDNLKD